jgi:hypothetical protein
MNVITISREMGSGGTAFARLLTKRLGFALFDKDIIFQAAQKARVDERDVRDYDQEAFNRAKAVLERLAPVEPPLFSPLARVHFPAAGRRLSLAASPLDQERYLAVTQSLLRPIGRRGRAIVLGRGGQVVLSGMKDALHLRIVAPLAARVKRVANAGASPSLRPRRRSEDAIGPAGDTSNTFTAETGPIPCSTISSSTRGEPAFPRR